MRKGKRLRDALRMLEALVGDAAGGRRYWDRFDCLNSDGRRLLHSITKVLLEEEPWLRRMVYEARREPCRSVLEKLLDRVRESARL